MKEYTNHKKKNLSDIFDIFESLANAQVDQTVLAMRGSGDFRVSEYFRHYEYSTGRWSQLLSEEQGKKVDAFLNSKLNKAMTEITVTQNYRKNDKEFKKL